MAEAIEKALEALKEKVGGQTVDGAVKLDFEDEGALRIDESGPKMDDGSEADVTIRGSIDTFKSMFDGDLSPTSAFMTGKIRIEGDMGVAMKVASLLG